MGEEKIESKGKNIFTSQSGKNAIFIKKGGKIYTISDNKNMSGNRTAMSNADGDFVELTIKEGTTVKLEGLPANIRYMSLGNAFAIFASKSGAVYGIGKNDYGQLGTGDIMSEIDVKYLQIVKNIVL